MGKRAVKEKRRSRAVLFVLPYNNNSQGGDEHP
jgi:hypothetical protein